MNIRQIIVDELARRGHTQYWMWQQIRDIAPSHGTVYRFLDGASDTRTEIAGAMLAFAFSMLEVSDSLILAQKQIHFPITTAIYNLFVGSLGNGPFLAAALGTWAMIFLAVSIVGAGFLLGKKMGALFRV